MDFNPASLIGGGIGALTGAVGGIINAVEGNAMKRRGIEMAASNVRPTYDIPEEVDSSINNIRSLMSVELPGASIMRNRASGITANTVAAAEGAARNPSDVLYALGNANENEQQANENIGIAGANNFLKENEEYRKALMTKAGYQDKKFAYNKDQPYQDKARAAANLIGAGIQNEHNGMNTILSSFGNFGNVLGASGVTGGAPAAKTNTGGFTPTTDQSAPQYGGFPNQFAQDADKKYQQQQQDILDYDATR